MASNNTIILDSYLYKSSPFFCSSIVLQSSILHPFRNESFTVQVTVTSTHPTHSLSPYLVSICYSYKHCSTAYLNTFTPFRILLWTITKHLFFKMRFSNQLFALVLSLPLAYAGNQITFVPQDDQPRMIYFTPNPGFANIPDLFAPAGKTVSATFPNGWQGNFKAPHSDADKNGNWILGEITFQGGDDSKQTSYDVSAIVNKTDGSGIHWLYPTSGNGAKSGCNTFPCKTAYVAWDDTQTQTTYETTLTCLLG